MTDTTLASFLLPDGFARPSLAAVLREGTVVAEAGRYAVRAGAACRTRPSPESGVGADPVVLVPGFLAGDASLALMGRALRAHGFRTYRAGVRVNAACTLATADRLEERLEAVAERRGSRVQVVGHSLGGMLARGLAVRRPDLVSGIVTLGSPVLAPAAHHLSLALTVEALVSLSRVGVRGLMAAECVAGDCARESFDEVRRPLPAGVAYTAIYSRRDGIVDWRACLDPAADAVEVTSSHLGMAVDPRVVDRVVEALGRGAGDRFGGLRIA